MQYRDGHISTYSIKTLVIYLYCVYCACASLIVFVIYYFCLLFIVIVHLFCSLFYSHRSLFEFCFIVRCSKEKNSILILNCILGISIPLYKNLLINNCTCCTRIPSSSMQVNKHHTVGGLETETCKHCTGDSPFKDTILLIVFSDRVVSWAACASWKACYPF